MLFQLYTNIDYPIVGFFFGKAALGVYRLAYDIVLEPVKVISDVIVAVAFPVFAKLKHDRQAMIDQLVAFTRLNLVTVMTYTCVVFIAADDILTMLFPAYAEAAGAIRILCAVAVLRAISYVLPSLLEGTGHAERSFRYTLVAAVMLPLCFLAGAWLLGPHLGYTSVAVAWAVGYPVAFAFLVYLTMQTVEWTAGAYLRRVAPTALAILAAGVVGGIVSALSPTELGFPLVAVAVVATVGGLLHRDLRAAVRSMRQR
jgi:teichuronic acid exporter